MEITDLWGKKRINKDGVLEHHALIYHMLESAAVAMVICERLFIGRVSPFEITDPRPIVYLVALHDIGKLTPAFQALDKEKVALLEKNGLKTAGARYENRHNRMSYEIVLEERLRGMEDMARSEKACLGLILGGHHGVFPEIRHLKVPPIQIGTGAWVDLRLQATDAIWSAIKPVELPRDPIPISSAITLSGLIAVADWISSNEDYFPYMTEVLSPEDCYHLALKKASDALDDIGWDRPVPRKRSFTDLFDVKPNHLQSTMVQACERIGSQCLTIVEAPTGEGKTEAALYLAGHLADCGMEGIFVGLPTRATSNQMLLRVHEFLTRKYDSEHSDLMLMHGSANLSSEVKVLEGAKRRVFTVAGVEEDEVYVNEWFTHRRRGLLSLHGVGTVDQAMTAALRTKHVTVKLFGLSNKVIIIDEVHAYDVYMETVITRLLTWLASMNCSVILLSATLSSAQKRRLIESFAGNAGLATPPEGVPYPRITMLDRAFAESIHVETSERSTKEVELRFLSYDLPEGIDSLLDEVEGSIGDGGCAAIICNTVATAQKVFLAAARRFPDEVDLFHARYMYKDRDLRENRNIDRFSKEGDRPDRFVLIATQVIEQSLDLDFDVIFSELAPADLLLQRIGRLWRHDRRRPAGIDHPVCHVIVNEHEKRGPVYDHHVILKTWLALKDRSVVSVPGDVEHLVEMVYGDAELKVPEEYIEEFEATLAEHERDIELQETKAKMICIPDPNNDSTVKTLREMTRDLKHEDRPSIHKELQAITRLTGPSVSIVCLFDNGGVVSLDREGELPINLSAPLDDAMIARLLCNSVTVNGSDWWVHAFRDRQLPEEWNNQWLRGYYRVVFKDSRATRGDFLLVLDEEAGLIKEYLKWNST